MSISLNGKTYNFAGISQPGNLSVYANRDAATPSGFSNVTCTVTGLNPGQSGNVRTSWKLKLPVVADTSSACSCPGDILDEMIVDVIVTGSRKSTTALRADVLKRIQDLVLTPEFGASVTGPVQPSA